MAAPPNVPKTPLDVLPSMLHAVFLHTANVFMDPRKHNPRSAANNHLHMRIPAAIDRYQYALDCLEVELLRAKSVFRRELEILREREEEEQAKVKAEREAEEARLKAIEEEEAAKKRTEQEAQEAKERAAAEQVAAAAKAEEARKNPKLKPTTTENIVANVNLITNLAGKDAHRPTPSIPQSTKPIASDIDMFNEGFIKKGAQKNTAQGHPTSSAFTAKPAIPSGSNTLPPAVATASAVADTQMDYDEEYFTQFGDLY
ncbi:hypothetical protein DFH27DRAFT_9545 [Peziza echinospora]|nr:hypothetical protein DFH27DRAFT_9545 [Peziza echinospora]